MTIWNCKLRTVKDDDPKDKNPIDDSINDKDSKSHAGINEKV